MAYRLGSATRQFFKTGGITLTDKSSKYGPGKIPLFKSLKNLNPRERVYAVGYNLTTLGSFGLDLGQIVSVPYLIGEYTNTARSVVKNLKQPTNLLGGQVLKRQKLLGGAKYVGKTKGAISRALRTGTPVDRATNIILGRESAGLLKNIREFGSAGALMEVVQTADARKMDAEILRQAQLPSKNNVFQKWQVLTFTEAFKGAPDPFRDNPMRKAEKIRSKTVKTKGDTFDVTSLQFNQDLNVGINATRANQLMSIADAQNFGGAAGFQGDIVNSILDAESLDYFKGKNKYEKLSTERRIRAMEQAEYNSIGKIMRSNSTQTRDYEDRETLKEGYTHLNTARNERGEKVQDIVYDPENQRMSTLKQRDLQNKLNAEFLRSWHNDIGAGGAVDFDVLSSFELGPDILNEMKNVAAAFNFPFPKLDKMSAAGMTDLLTQMVTTVSSFEVKQGFFVGAGMQASSLQNLVDALRKNGYTTLAKVIKSQAGFTKKSNPGLDILPFNLNKGFLKGRNNIINNLQGAMNQGVLYSLVSGKNPGDVDLGYRFQPTGDIFSNTKMMREYLGRKGSTKYSLGKIQFLDSDTGPPVVKSYRGVTGDHMTLPKTKKYFNKLGVGDVTGGGSGFHSTVKEPNRDRYFSYEDFLSGNVKGMSVELAPNGKFKKLHLTGSVHRQFKKTGKVYGKPEQWWMNKLTRMHSEFANNLKLIGMGSILNELTGATVSTDKGSLTRKIEKAMLDNGKRSNLIENMTGTTYGGSVFHEGKTSFQGKSTALKNSHNYVPTRGQIRKSIHMHDMDRFGRNENDGTPYLFRFSVSAGGSNKNSKTADAIRDIAQIEYGGFAHDKNMQIEKRTDGMFFLPSHFMGIAGTKSAAYLGIWDKGTEFRSNVDGMDFAAKISGSGAISPLDLKGDGPNRSRTRFDVKQIKEDMRQGKNRLAKLEKDLTQVFKDGARTNSSFNSAEARIASQKSLALFRNTGQFGNMSGGDLFTSMDDVTRGNLGITGDKVASNFTMNSANLGYYSAGSRKYIGKLSDPLGDRNSIHGITHSYGTGNNNVGRLYTTKYRNLATGMDVYGEMPVVPLLNNQLNKLQNIFTELAHDTVEVNRYGGGTKRFNTAKNSVNWNAFSEFTGLSPGKLRHMVQQSRTAGQVDTGFDYRLDWELNPSEDPVIRKIIDGDVEGVAEVFGLKNIDGPMHTLGGKKIPLNSPAHPTNMFKKAFLNDAGVAREIQVYTYQAYQSELAGIISSLKGTAKGEMLERQIRQYARENAEVFMRSLNKAILNHLGLSETGSELPFRAFLRQVALTVKYCKLNATKNASSIRNRMGETKLLTEEIADVFYQSDGKLDLDLINSSNVQLIPDEDGIKLVAKDASNNVVKVLANEGDFSAKEAALMEFYSEEWRNKSNFAADPKYGIHGNKAFRDLGMDPADLTFDNIYSQAGLDAQIQALVNNAHPGDRGNKEKILSIKRMLADSNNNNFESGPELKGKFKNGIEVGVDQGLEKVVVDALRDPFPSSESVMRGMGPIYNRGKTFTHVLRLAKYGVASHREVAQEYFKSLRKTARTVSDETVYSDLLALSAARGQSSAVMGRTNELAKFVEQMWYASVPTGGQSGGKAVRVTNFLASRKVEDANKFRELPPEYHKLVRALHMLGFNFKNFIETNHGAIPTLSTNDFNEIAKLLKMHATSPARSEEYLSRALAGRFWNQGPNPIEYSPWPRG